MAIIIIIIIKAVDNVRGWHASDMPWTMFTEVVAVHKKTKI